MRGEPARTIDDRTGPRIEARAAVGVVASVRAAIRTFVELGVGLSLAPGASSFKLALCMALRVALRAAPGSSASRRLSALPWP